MKLGTYRTSWFKTRLIHLTSKRTSKLDRLASSFDKRKKVKVLFAASLENLLPLQEQIILADLLKWWNFRKPFFCFEKRISSFEDRYKSKTTIWNLREIQKIKFKKLSQISNLRSARWKNVMMRRKRTFKKSCSLSSKSIITWNLIWMIQSKSPKSKVLKSEKSKSNLCKNSKTRPFWLTKIENSKILSKTSKQL